jgi:hypothetical protein
VHTFPEGHPLHLHSFGDPELDKLCNENLVGLLKSKEMRKRRRKRKPKPVEEVNDLSFETDYFFNSQVAFSAEPPDEHQFEGLIPEVNNPWFYF